MERSHSRWPFVDAVSPCIKGVGGDPLARVLGENARSDWGLLFHFYSPGNLPKSAMHSEVCLHGHGFIFQGFTLITLTEPGIVTAL
jgi:hypothetical protein